MDKESLPTGLQTLILGAEFNQRMDKDSLPAGFLTLISGSRHHHGQLVLPLL